MGNVYRRCTLFLIAVLIGIAAGAAEPASKDPEAVVFRGRYKRTTGPCIELGDGILAMPFIDTFSVVKVEQGKFLVNEVEVRPLSEGGPRYPQDLKDGEVYTLRLALTPSTNEQLAQEKSKPLSFLWVDGEDLAVEQVPAAPAPKALPAKSNSPASIPVSPASRFLPRVRRR